MNTTLKPTHLDPALLDRISSRVAEKTTINSAIAADANNVGLRIDGSINGNIVLGEDSVLHIAPTGRVKAENIEVDYLFNEGTLEGDVIVRKGGEASATSTTKGKVRYKSVFAIVPRAKVNGEVSFTG